MLSHAEDSLVLSLSPTTYVNGMSSHLTASVDHTHARFEWTCYALAAAPGFTIALPLVTSGSLPNIVQRATEYLPFRPTTLLHPAWMFVIFLVSSMAPRALRSHWWYHDTFGDRYPKSRKAVLPWLL